MHGAYVMDRIFPSGTNPGLTRMLSYSAPAGSRSAVGYEPCDLVGVAVFEPAASSSRSQIAERNATAVVNLTSERPSVNVRQRPVMYVPVVTQLVTRLVSSCPGVGPRLVRGQVIPNSH